MYYLSACTDWKRFSSELNLKQNVHSSLKVTEIIRLWWYFYHYGVPFASLSNYETYLNYCVGRCKKCRNLKMWFLKRIPRETELGSPVSLFQRTSCLINFLYIETIHLQFQITSILLISYLRSLTQKPDLTQLQLQYGMK